MIEKGNKYGLWKALRFDRQENKRKFWHCVCECGTKRSVNYDNLIQGLSTNCGCVRKKKTIDRNTKHGLSAKHRRAFNAWNAMRQRCYNTKHPRYFDWGGRGIKVCKRWERFENFLDDMGDPPKGKQLDRVNNDKGYSPSNCRWVSRRVNMNNRRTTVRVTYKGKTLPLSKWSDKTGIRSNVLHQRLLNLGWSPKKAFTTPVD